MISKLNNQFDLFSKQQFLWQRQATLTKSQLQDQLALLLLSCFKQKEQFDQQPNKENQPCPVK